jgi:hypothetical protein
VSGMTTTTNDLDRLAVYRIGAISALVVGMLYIVITAVYAVVGPPPQDGGGEAFVEYLAGKDAAWWAITGLSVLTDILYLPVVLALYSALRHVDRSMMLVGAGLLTLFVVLDLAVTWPNYAALMTLSTEAAGATGADRATLVAAASYPSAVLASLLFPVYAILVPALGILAIGVVMLRGSFDRASGSIGVATGALGTVAVVGGLIVDAVGLLAVLTALLTTVWFFVVGYRLLGASRS